MPQIAEKCIRIQDLKMLDLVMTGEAARLMGCDHRTFIKWAEKLSIEPVATLTGGKRVYKREDVEKIVKAYKLFLHKKATR